MPDKFTQLPLFPTTKYCPCCKQKLPKENFGSNKSRWDGLQYICRRCDADRAREWRSRHPEKARESLEKLKRNTTPERAKELTRNWMKRNPERVKAAKQKYLDIHRDRVRAEERERRAQNPEARREQRKQWIAKRPEHHREMWRNASNRRNARKRGNGTGLTAQEWLNIQELYGNKCLACGSTENIEMDHVIPISLGGPHQASNIQPLCRSCNAKKSATTIDYRP